MYREGHQFEKKYETLNPVQKLLKTLSHIEAKIDFPEEDLPKNVIKEILALVLDFE